MMQPEILHDATDRVMSVAWSADGRLAVGSADTMVYVYDQEPMRSDFYRFLSFFPNA